MDILYVVAALAVLGIIYMRFEAGFLKVKTLDFNGKRKGMKIIQLSDIHIGKLRVKLDEVKNIIASENPDFVIISGDCVEKPGQTRKFLEFLMQIKGSSKVFLCLGNHDYEAFEKDENGLAGFISEIEGLGVEILHNRSVVYEKDSKKYNIIGIGDVRSKKSDVDKALGSLTEDAEYNVGFSHNPDIALEIPNGKVDYLFCGHYHGGQIWAPFDFEFKLLRKDKLCKMGIKRGLHKFNGINLYINAGLGNVLVPLRFLSRPEITVVYLP